MHVEQMIATHPNPQGGGDASLIACIEACYECAQTCISCADACLGEPDVKDLDLCIRLNQDCADVCLATGAIATRRTGGNPTVLQQVTALCAEACRVCADECDRHADMHEHCRICAQACRDCEAACRAAADAVGATVQ